MSSGRVKGITIEIDGNTTKLQTALKGVDSSLSKTQSSLRDVNRLLKFDPKNTELLTQKQTMLKKSISDTQKKLQTLKDAEKQAQKAFAEGKISQDQYDALKREIVDTENKLKSLKKEASLAGQVFKNIGSKMQKVGGGIKNIGEKLMPVSAGTAAVGVACGKMAIDFDDSIARINTLLDDDSHLEGYKNATKTLSDETGLNLQTTADGMYQTISSIGDQGKETEKIFMTMGKSAKAGGAEVADSVSLISAGMKGYNSVNDKTAQKISDLAFQTAKLGVTTFPEMAQSMQPLFPLSSSLNMSYEELFGTMATLTGVTGNTAEVSTQLKAVFSNLMKPTGAMTELMHKYGYESGAAMIESEGFQGVLSILKEETGGQSDKLAELFSSTEALTGITALVGPQFDIFGEKLTAMGDCAGATEKAYGKMNTKGDEMRKSMNELKNAGTELGGSLMETLAPIISTVADGISNLCTWFDGLTDKQKRTVIIIGTIIALSGPALLILGSLISSIGTISGAIGTLISFLGLTGPAGQAAGLGVAAFQLPMLPTIAIIGSLIAIGVLLYKNWDTIKAKAGELKNAMVEKWNSIKSKTSETFNAIKNTIKEKIDGAKNAVKSGIDKIKGFFNFEWHLPKLKLPHFKASGKFSLNPPSVPSFGIDWYSKAMDQAHILTGANIFGMMDGQFLGGGEKGSEMVVGTNYMMSMIQKATAKNDAAVVGEIQKGNNSILNLMQSYFPQFVMGNITIGNRSFKRTLKEMGVVFA